MDDFRLFTDTDDFDGDPKRGEKASPTPNIESRASTNTADDNILILGQKKLEETQEVGLCEKVFQYELT